MAQNQICTVGLVLFPGFELLDVFGPLEVLASPKRRFTTVLVAQEAGLVESAQGPKVLAEYGFLDCPPLEILLVPGGPGTRREIENLALIDWLVTRGASSEVIFSMCTGAALLARAGLLDGRAATTNKPLPGSASRGRR